MASPTFVPTLLLPSKPRPSQRTVCNVTMRSGKRKSGGDKGRRPSNAISRLPPEERAKIDDIANQYGVEVPRAGSGLDRQYTSSSKGKDTAPEVTLYQMLANTFGVSTLDNLETATYVLLGLLLFAFLGTGLAIASEAFFAASKVDIPPTLDSVAVVGARFFTPLLVVFIVLSSMLGLYKQSQLNSGAAQYDETKPRSR